MNERELTKRITVAPIHQADLATKTRDPLIYAQDLTKKTRVANAHAHTQVRNCFRRGPSPQPPLLVASLYHETIGKKS